MCRAGMTLDDLGGRLSERALLAFCRHLPAESAAAAELSDMCGWSRAEMLLARICEGVERFAWLFATRGLPRSKWPNMPRPIPRPGVEPEGKRIGRDPMPISGFDEWYYGGDI